MSEDLAIDATSAAEEAIRRYLMWLSDPASIVDAAAIEQAEAEARQATDVIAKLKAISRVDQLRAGDAASVKAAFVHHARAWGEANQISPASWIRLGVPPEVLREAGVTGGRTAPRPATSRPRAASGGGGGSRGGGVSAAAIIEHVSGLTEPFILADLAAAVGGSPMTLRKAIEQLQAEGRVTRLGPDPHHNARGRAPIRYQTKR